MRMDDFDLWSKVLSLGKTQINFAFRLLFRTFDLWSKVLSLGKIQINFAFRSFFRTFVPDSSSKTNY